MFETDPIKAAFYAMSLIDGAIETLAREGQHQDGCASMPDKPAATCDCGIWKLQEARDQIETRMMNLPI